MSIGKTNMATIFAASILLTACVTEDESSDSALLLKPGLYEYTGVSYSDNGKNWIGDINFRVYDNERCQRVYYGGDVFTNLKKNIIVTGKYKIQSGKIAFRDERILRINITGCNGWKDTNSVLEFPIRNIKSDEFEIHGNLELWDVPETLKDHYNPPQDWLSISDYTDSTSWPADIRKCGLP